ncbi:MAG: hypothetical protein WAN66_13915 [Limnoraphis robusta]|uniref:Uncharacterized protein n=1 Tax=Limnoraphis robusta CS-951 TaxID=1637645 RepID=A0A0F5YIK2_9CYAN|nr:hypothetical protein [Limnoraphis robusta]KKD38025.1 hypothetical protein WN50_11105 [Limnoraphis robusta CS-951]
MEPVELTLAALAALIITKATEKTGEKLGEKLFEQGGTLLQQLRCKSPQTALAIEKVNETPLDWGQAVIDVKKTAETDPEFAKVVEDVEATIIEDADLRKRLEEIATTIKSQPATVNNSAKLAEKINALFQGTTITGGNVGNTGIVGSTIEGGTFNI